MTTLQTLKAAREAIDDDARWARTGEPESQRSEYRTFLDGAILDAEMTQQKLAIAPMIVGAA